MAGTLQSLNTLLKKATIDDHEEVLAACNASLKQSKGDIELQYIKIIALLKLDRFEDALRVLDLGDDNLKQKARLERAYALYKTGELEQARTIARSIVGDRGARHIEAQASYRREIFSEASILYKDLASTIASIDDEENDLRINGGATDAQLEWSRQGHLVEKRKPTREDLEVFETAYNTACVSIARGELRQGEILLKTAKGLCNSLDELSDQDKTAEILPIGVQQLYVLGRLGKTEEAEHIASGIHLPDIPDLSTRQIAQNNQLALATKPANPYLSHRLFRSATTLPKSDKLFQFQAERVHQNSLTLELLVLKYAGVIKSTSKILGSTSATLSSHANSISVLNAAAHAQNQLGKLGLKQILPLLEKRPKDVGLVLTIIQLYILTNNPGSATTVLESLLKRLSESSTPSDQDVLFAPGLIAILVSLYTSQGRKSQIKATLAKAASYWRHRSKPPISLLQAAGLALLDSSSSDHQSLAMEIFSILHSLDPTSRLAAAGYIAAHTLTSHNSSSAPLETNTLTSVPQLIAGIDIAALEAAGVPRAATAPVPATRKRALHDPPKPAKKRVRKSKLPKDYDPAKTPDPERWLPLRDRTSYKPKGKKGRARAAALTQGGPAEKEANGGAGGRGAAGGGESAKGGGGEGVIKAGKDAGGTKAKKKGKGKK